MDCLPCLFSSFSEDHKQDGSPSPWLSSHTNEAYGVRIPAELANFEADFFSSLRASAEKDEKTQAEARELPYVLVRRERVFEIAIV